MIEHVSIQRLQSEDIKRFIELICVFEEVFEMRSFVMPDEKYLSELLKKDSFHAFVALHEDKVVGGLTAYTLPVYYSESPLVYIYDLAVKTEFQRKGIGKMLMSDINSYCKSIGVKEVFVQADLEDDHAIDFYTSTGGLAEDVIQFTYLLK